MSLKFYHFLLLSNLFFITVFCDRIALNDTKQIQIDQNDKKEIEKKTFEEQEMNDLIEIVTKMIQSQPDKMKIGINTFEDKILESLNEIYSQQFGFKDVNNNTENTKDMKNVINHWGKLIKNVKNSAENLKNELEKDINNTKNSIKDIKNNTKLPFQKKIMKTEENFAGNFVNFRKGVSSDIVNAVNQAKQNIGKKNNSEDKAEKKNDKDLSDDKVEKNGMKKGNGDKVTMIDGLKSNKVFENKNDTNDTNDKKNINNKKSTKDKDDAKNAKNDQMNKNSFAENVKKHKFVLPDRLKDVEKNRMELNFNVGDSETGKKKKLNRENDFLIETDFANTGLMMDDDIEVLSR